VAMWGKDIYIPVAISIIIAFEYNIHLLILESHMHHIMDNGKNWNKLYAGQFYKFYQNYKKA